MSTILKALRRLEDDRAVNEQRPLRETVTAGATPGPPKRSRGRAGWIIALVVLLGVGVGAGYLAFQTAVEDEAPQLAAATATPSVERLSATRVAVEPTPDETEIVPPGQPNDAGAAAESVRELPDAAFSSPVARLDRPAPGPRIEDTPPPAVAPEPTEELATAESAPTTTRLVRGQPLVPPSQLPGRQPLASRSDIVTRVEPGVPVQKTTPQPPRAEREPRAPQPTRAPEAAPEPVLARAPAPARRQPAEVSRQPTARAKASPPPAAPVDPRPSRAEVTPAAAPPEPTPVREPAPVIASAPTPTPAAAPKPEPARSEPAAKTSDESAIAQAAVPDLLVDGTSWHPTASRRTATVQIAKGEMVEVHEGDAVGLLVVSRIEPSSVVFTHDGIEIRRRIGQR